MYLVGIYATQVTMNQLKQQIYLNNIKHKLISKILKQQWLDYEEQQNILKLKIAVIAQYALFSNRRHFCTQ